MVEGEAAAATSAVVAAAAATSVDAAVAAATSATVAAAAAVAAAVEATAAEARPRGSRYAFVARLHPRGLASPALPSRLVLHARGLGFALAAQLRPHITIKQHSSGRKRCFGSATTYLPQR